MAEKGKPVARLGRKALSPPRMVALPAIPSRPDGRLVCLGRVRVPRSYLGAARLPGVRYGNKDY